MFGRKTVVDMINRSAENASGPRQVPPDRRAHRAAPSAAPPCSAPATAGVRPTPTLSDAAVLNFALNLEYLEAEFYLNAVPARASPRHDRRQRHGGRVTGGRKVTFKSKIIRQYANEIAADERAHVNFLRTALGAAKVGRPAIDLEEQLHRRGAGRRPDQARRRHSTRSPTRTTSCSAAFIFEDVGVTAYKGAAPLITNKTYLDAAAGILAVEAYHAGIVRTTLYARA